jgi:hypothetical protein
MIGRMRMSEPIIDEIQENLKRTQDNLKKLKENKNPLTEERLQELFMEGWNKGYKNYKESK